MSEEAGNLSEFLKEKVLSSGQDQNELLRAQLAGLIKIEVQDSDEQAFLGFKNNELEIASSSADPAACTIVLSKSDLTALVEGELNPQIALLSDKLKVSGDMTMAMYLCNLFSKESQI